MARIPEKKQLTLLKNYLSAIENCIADESLLVKAAYFEAFCALFDDAIRLSYAKHKNYKYKSLADVLSPLQNVDISKIMTSGKTKVTKSTILPYLQQTINEQIEISEDMI